jgi:ubiquinone/menaquinone biosynthesis C-methylase UbiE
VILPEESVMLESPHERFLPWSGDAQSAYEHLHRYAWATQSVKGKKVLDLACGEGYGSFMLAQHADRVTGIDIDQETVIHARNTYPRDNLDFVEGSITDVPISGAAEFDVIVCYEALEHIEDHERLLSEVKRLLKDDGLFIVSTPNKTVYTDESDFHNPCHVKELHFAEFKTLLGNHFSSVRFWGQRVFPGSSIWDIPASDEPRYLEFVIDKGVEQFHFVDRQAKPPLYYVALASNRAIEPREANINSWLVDVSYSFGQDYHKIVADLRNAIHAKYAQEPVPDDAQQAKDAQIAELGSAVKARDAEIGALKQELQAMKASGPRSTAASPTGTGRRGPAALVRRGVEVLFREGPVALLRKSWRRVRVRPSR